MSRQKEYTKSDLTFDELLKAGLNTPPAPAPKTPRKKPVAKKPRKRVKGKA